MVKCNYCQKEYEPKRKSACYCSDLCRNRANRGTPLPTPEPAPQSDPLFQRIMTARLLNTNTDEYIRRLLVRIETGIMK